MKETKSTVYFVTSNKSKFQEAKKILDNPVKLVRKDLNLTEPKTLSQEDVFLEKARQAYSKLKKPVLVDDTGIYFEAYNDFPGTYTKALFKSLGFKGVERLLEGRNRKAYFKTLLCYKDKQTTTIFSGVWKGRIVKDVSKMFNPDWQYNSIFIPEGFKKPLSEIPLETRAKQSHRLKALQKFERFIKLKCLLYTKVSVKKTLNKIIRYLILIKRVLL